VRHEDVEALTIEDMSIFDDTDDLDIPFITATSAPWALVIEPENKLLLWSNKEFAPNGDVTVESGGSGALYDGSIGLSDNSIFTAVGSEAHSFGGSWIAATSSTFVRADSEVIFTATTSGKSIAPASPFEDVTFTGSGGEWSIASSTTLYGALQATNGTVTGSADLTVFAGPVTGDGTISMTGGTVTVLSGNSFAGNSDWTFNNLFFSTSTATTTTKVGSGTVTINGTLTIGANHTLEAGSVEWFLSGSGTVFKPTGTFVPQTSTTTYNGGLDLTVAATDYYVLNMAPSLGTPTYTVEAGNFAVNNNFFVGGGTTLTAEVNTNDPLITVAGDMTIAASATYAAASANDLLIGGSYANSGTFTANGGGLVFNSVDTGETINAGGSSFHHVYFTDALGGWTVTEHATATGNFSISSTSAWTLASGKTLEVQGMFSNLVGGAATTWTGSTLYLNSGTSYSVNTRTHAGDTYGTLSVGANTDPRMWYSSSSAYSINNSGSLYSQDHDTTDGDLYVWGDYVRSSGNDYWRKDTLLLRLKSIIFDRLGICH
jgi:hypothetical protein